MQQITNFWFSGGMPMLYPDQAQTSEPAPTDAQLVERWLADKTAATAKIYRRVLTAFLASGNQLLPGSAQAVSSFLQDVGTSVYNQRLAALKVFYVWAMAQGYTASDPTITLKRK